MLFIESFQTTVARVICESERERFGKEHTFHICLSQKSTGKGLRELAESDDASVSFFNRAECCQRFNITDDKDNIKIIEKVISEVPAQSVVLFDEVPLSCKNLMTESFSTSGRNLRRGPSFQQESYDWSTLKNKRPDEVTAVVCLQPIRLDVTFKNMTLDVTGPEDADVIVLTNQYRNTTKILKLVNKLYQDELPIQYANVKVLPSHDVEGPEITAMSISCLNQAGDLRMWLCDQLQKKLGCKPSQVKIIYLSSTKELAESVINGTVFQVSMTSIDDFQGCEIPVAAVFLGSGNDYSQIVEMCSRAQYKLIMVICANVALHRMIENTMQISVEDISNQATILVNREISAETGDPEADANRPKEPEKSKDSSEDRDALGSLRSKSMIKAMRKRIVRSLSFGLGRSDSPPTVKEESNYALFERQQKSEADTDGTLLEEHYLEIIVYVQSVVIAIITTISTCAYYRMTKLNYQVLKRCRKTNFWIVAKWVNIHYFYDIAALLILFFAHNPKRGV